MDLLIYGFLRLIKNITWIFPLLVIILYAYKRGYREAIQLYICMLMPTIFCWIKIENKYVILEQLVIYLLVAIILILDLFITKKNKLRKKLENSNEESIKKGNES